jgi:hypothetical protein
MTFGLAPRIDTFRYQVSTVPVSTVPETAGVDKWFTPASEPVRARPGLGGQHQRPFEAVKGAPFPEAVTLDRWLASLSEPVRQKIGLSPSSAQSSLAFVEAAPFPETVTLDRWQVALSEPARRRLSALQIGQPAAFFYLVPVSGSGVGAVPSGSFATPRVQWFQYQISTAVPPTTAETITADKWWASLSLPTRRGGLAVNHQQPAAYVGAAPFGESVSIDRWLQPYSEPVRVRVSLAAPRQQHSAYVAAAPFTENVTADRWLNAFAQPARRSLPNFGAATTFVGDAQPLTGMSWFGTWSLPSDGAAVVIDASSTFIAIENVTEDRWHQPFSEPVRSRPALSVANQRAFALTSAAPFGETVSVDRWVQPYSEPIRLRRARGPDVTHVPTLAVSGDGLGTIPWFMPYSEPVRPRRGRGPDVVYVATVPVVSGSGVGAVPSTSFATPRVQWFQYQISTAVLFTPPTETITTDKWFRSFAEPTRRNGLAVPQQQAAAFVKAAPFPESVSLDRWLASLSEPVRARRTIGIDAAFVPIVIAAASTDTRWLSPLAEPVRARLGLAAHAQLPLAFVQAAPFAETVSADRWFATLSEPARRRALLTSLNPAAVLVTAPAEAVSLDKWAYGFSEPVRSRPGLLTADQQTLAYVLNDATAHRWLMPLSEPVRARAGLAAPNQQALAFVKAAPFAETVSIDRWLRALSEPTRRPVFHTGAPTFAYLAMGDISLVYSASVVVSAYGGSVLIGSYGGSVTVHEV